MNYLQDIFITFWTVWTYKNKVVHQGIILDLVEVILTAQTFSCRYRDTLSSYSTPADKEGKCYRLERQFVVGD